MKKTLLTLVLCCIWVGLGAQKIIKVKGEATYHAPTNVTLEEARQTVLERAIVQALADAFGTTVSQVNTSLTDNRNGKSNIDFSSIGATEVKGEWLETIGEPEYSEPRYAENMLIISCRVEGRAREITTEAFDLKCRILRNGTEDKFEGGEFRSGDDLYLSFLSPVGGYLAVYLVDAERQALCLLPYQRQQSGIYPIEANRRYVFFHEKSAPAEERSVVDEYTMTCERSSEQNLVFIVFSPKQFAKAADTSMDSGLPRQLSFADFNQWLVRHRRKDPQMNVRRIPITISK